MKKGKWFWLKVALLSAAVIIAAFYTIGRLNPERKQTHPCFSAWDGAHVELESWVKGQMFDPSTYRHIKTTYATVGNRIDIRMTFEAKNRLGGVIRAEARASCDAQCNLIGQPAILN